MNNKSKNKGHIKECMDDAEIMETFAIMTQLRTIEKNTYVSTIRTLMKEGYHLVAYFSDDTTCLGALGYNVGHRLSVGKMVYIADLVVDEKYRSCQLGNALMDWVKEEALRLNCQTIILDSGVHRAPAHKFYFNNGFEIASYNFKFFNE